VLVDAPCSGLGTLRRNPDLKFRQSPASVAELTQKQAAILASPAACSRRGDDWYMPPAASCLKRTADRPDFSCRASDFVLRPAGEILLQQKIALEAGDYLELRPQLHGTDGFFAAVLERLA